jgi:signal peptidase I
MTFRKQGEVSLPTKKQVEAERKRYRRKKAYNKALRGTVYVLTIVAAVAVLIATLILPVLQIEGTSMEPTCPTVTSCC